MRKIPDKDDQCVRWQTPVQQDDLEL